MTTFKFILRGAVNKFTVQSIVFKIKISFRIKTLGKLISLLKDTSKWFDKTPNLLLERGRVYKENPKSLFEGAFDRSGAFNREGAFDRSINARCY